MRGRQTLRDLIVDDDYRRGAIDALEALEESLAELAVAQPVTYDDVQTALRVALALLRESS